MIGRPRAALYTPDLLALAVSLADYPLDPAMALAGEARSRTCGSMLKLTCSTDERGRIGALGMQVAACAVGQAAAALFARNASGASVADIERARHDIAQWLAGNVDGTPWPGFGVLDAARAHAARHGAILLAWDAALGALSKAEARG